jgi:8-hydroxy-5-deazaflavin:NADPH oxidoreductase
MGYKAFASMNIAIVGNGKTTAVLAQGLALAGHEIMIGIKEDEQISFDYLEAEFENIEITTIDDAAAAADVIFITSTPEEVREMAYLLDDVRRKVIIDTTFMNLHQTGGYLNTVGAITAITGSPHVVKCFNAAGFEVMESFSKKDGAINMFVAGDSKKGKEVVRLLARDLGFADCHDFGDSDAVALLDEMAICYQNLVMKKAAGEKIAIKITRQ